MPEPIAVKPSEVLMPALAYQFHQVAIYTEDQETAMEQYSALGFGKWIEDTAELKGLLYGEPVLTQGRMNFCYGVMPMELEFLTYFGPSRHAMDGRTGGAPFISHMSTYVDDVKEASVELAKRLGVLPYHRFITQNHTNPGVVGKKRFIESIFDTRHQLGYDLKLIQKVAWDYDDEDWLGFKF